MRLLILAAAAMVPWAIVFFITGDALLAFLAYVVPSSVVEIALVGGRRRYWRVTEMLWWLGPITARFEAARAARLASPETATTQERQFDLARAAALEPDKPGDPDFAAYYHAASLLPDAEMRSYEIASVGLALALIADRRGYDYMPYLVQAADEMSDIRLRPRQRVLLWLLRWYNVIILCLVGLFASAIAASWQTSFDSLF